MSRPDPEFTKIEILAPVVSPVITGVPGGFIGWSGTDTPRQIAIHCRVVSCSNGNNSQNNQKDLWSISKKNQFMFRLKIRIADAYLVQKVCLVFTVTNCILKRLSGVSETETNILLLIFFLVRMETDTLSVQECFFLYTHKLRVLILIIAKIFQVMEFSVQR